MHAVMRRMPAERARHAKRLVLAASPIPTDTPSVTTTQQETTTATSASSQTIRTSASSTQSSSSALPPSSATQSSSFVSSSATTSSTSLSVTSSASTQPPTPTAPSSSLIAQPTVLTSTYPTSSTSTPQTNAAAVTNSGLSGGAIAGIIAGAVIVGVALIVFFVRKTYLRRRERKRISWDGAPGLGAGILDEPKFPDISERTMSFTSAPNTPQRGAPLSPFEAYGQSMYSIPVAPTVRMQPPTISTYVVPSPPPATYNNPTPVAAYPTQPVPSTYSLGNNTAFAGMSSPLPSVRAQHAPVEATVKCTFVPTLPDELSITTGERVFIVEQYDDGWDLCANGRGERGMVPRECLERAPSDQSGIDWRDVRRMSSLNPDGKRF